MREKFESKILLELKKTDRRLNEERIIYNILIKLNRM